MQFINLTNQTFTHWTVIGPHEIRLSKKKRQRTFWFCQCQCGKQRWVLADNLRKGSSTNCGCLKPRHSEAQNAHYVKLSQFGLKHGMAGANKATRLYRIWQSMKARCNRLTDTAYKNYGARGITVCTEWQEFEPFRDWSLANGYTEKLTIERNNVDGNYQPDNCRYIPLGEQTRNTRRTLRIHSISLAAFCEKYAVPYLWTWSALKLKELHPEVWKLL